MRKCKNLVTSYLAYVEESESPTKYHIWSFLSAVAAVARRQVWVNMGHFEIYPNMFIVLVGPPGARKTQATRIAARMARNVTDIHLSAESITREGLIKALVDAQKQSFMRGSNIVYHASLTVISEELSVFIGKDEHNFLSLLTTLYDCQDNWTYRTKGSGTDKLLNVWFNLLGATTPEWLSGSIPLSAIGGGFTSRILFVVEEGPRQRIPRPRITPEMKLIGEEIAHDLQEIANLNGEIVFDQDAGDLFDDWYRHKKEPLESDPRFKGYAERKHIHVLKVSMLLSLCEGDSLRISKDNFELARSLVEETEEKMVEAFGSIGRSEVALDVGEIMDVMKIVKKISQKDLLRDIWRNVSPQRFEQAMTQLMQLGYIAKFYGGKDGTQIFYEYTK